MKNLTPLHIRVLLGVGIKSLGYLIVAAGIFLSLRDKNLALKTVYIGVCFVIFGWFVVLRALKLAKSVKVKKSELPFERKFKISAYVDGGFLGLKEGDPVSIRGAVMEKVGRYWRNAEGTVILVLNGIPISRTVLSKGRFEFILPNLRKGVYDACVRFVEGCEEKRVKISIMSRDEWRRNLKLFLLATSIIFLLICLPFVFLIP